SGNPSYKAKKFRYNFTSLKTPSSVYDYDMISEELLAYSTDDKNTLNAAEKLAKMTVDNDKKNQDYLLSYAKILHSNKKSAEALKYAKKSLALHLKKEIPAQEVEELIERIQSM
ncbi:MAG: hypothetical protein P8M34_09330, partial [Saprospiraceae bacterium]|nr:hypothetical protein [Saprospiraceae bacterium]